ncbi:MAG: class I SAM-dependent methyltransferase [Chloroflexi bacterium]|nr:class I SAM-dependent methyltransferase [Chloroflexota bacterium]
MAEIKQRQSKYLELFLDRENVLDLGCGRGEFVELLSERGVQVTGVDLNEDMVDFCRDRGLRVVLADIFDYLTELPDESVDGIFAAQVVEHFPPERIAELIALGDRKLKPGGIMLAETINTHCPEAMNWFYLDPTHVRPVPVEMLQFLFKQGHFRLQSACFSAPVAGSNVSELLELTESLPREINFYQDYAVVAVRQ